jgi:hypothetical protein
MLVVGFSQHDGAVLEADQRAGLIGDPGKKRVERLRGVDGPRDLAHHAHPRPQ